MTGTVRVETVALFSYCSPYDSNLVAMDHLSTKQGAFTAKKFLKNNESMDEITAILTIVSLDAT
jgi:hypothetical protein